MNRNVESHFATLPRANIERSTFDTSCNIKTSFNCGDLIPFGLWEILPGDSWDVTTSKVIRSQTMLTPLFGDLMVDTYFFFVPSRLCWNHWREFCGENTESAWAPEIDSRLTLLLIISASLLVLSGLLTMSLLLWLFPSVVMR